MRELDRRRLAAGRLQAATRFPYLAAAVFATRVLPVQRPGLVAVDEFWRIYIDPGLVAAWSAEELGAVLVHHSGHLLRDHAGRARSLGIGKGEAERWLLAADAEINDDLVGAGMRFPEQPVLPDSLGMPPGRFAEEYYRLLPDGSRQGDCGSGCDGLQRAWDEGSEGVSRAAANLLRCQVAGEVLRSCRGLQPGTVPLGLRRWAEDLLGSRVDWRRLLAAEIRRGVSAVAGCVDYSYRRPSRRACAVPDVVLPTLQRPIPELAVVVDTSGSMDEQLLGQALAEIQGLLRALGLGGRRLPVLPCDASVHGVQRVASVGHVELVGGGGTNMGEGIAAARRLRPPASVVVVLTDGLTPWPAAPPAGLRVVVGLLRQNCPQPPGWARVVAIDEAA